MNWDAIGAIGEVVGAVAVVISLIYLALQIRLNNRLLQRQAFDAAGTDFSALRLHTSSTPQIASVWRRAKQDYSELAPDERAQANELFHEYLWAFHNIYSRIESGRSDDLLASLIDVNIPYWFSNPGVRQWWLTESKTPFTADFEAVVDKICGQIEKTAQQP